MDSGAGYGLAAPYLMLVNVVAHLAGAVRWRVYNPGLWTACGLFAPLALLALWRIAAGLLSSLGVLQSALAIHAAIIGHYRRLEAAPSSSLR